MDPLAALADPVRRALLRQLVAGPARVVDLASDHAISRPAVSRHLRVLAEAGLVSVEDHGRERHYALERGGLMPVRELLADLTMPVLLDPRVLDGLDLEVRRTGRDRRIASPSRPATTTEETA